ncbi:hypothetical protein BH23GEM6_BH23GEM6_01960 [soil metagenome]
MPSRGSPRSPRATPMREWLRPGFDARAKAVNCGAGFEPKIKFGKVMSAGGCHLPKMVWHMQMFDARPKC